MIKDKNGCKSFDKMQFELWFNNFSCQKHINYYWEMVLPSNKHHQNAMNEKGA